jgi:hypothetical protein
MKLDLLVDFVGERNATPENRRDSNQSENKICSVPPCLRVDLVPCPP